MQQCCARVCELVQFSTPNMSQYVDRNMLRSFCRNLQMLQGPTILGYVVLKCCDRLVGACINDTQHIATCCKTSQQGDQTPRHVAPNNVAICCIEVLRSFAEFEMADLCCIFKFLRRSVDGKQFIHFQSETSVFKFLRHSVNGALNSKPWPAKKTKTFQVVISKT